MSQLTAAPLATADAESSSPLAAAFGPSPVPGRINEHHVALSTAATAPVVVTRRHRQGADLVTGFVRAFTALTQPRPQCRRHEPSYLEAARMSREMYRL